MPVIYNSNKIIPGPFCSITKKKVKSEDGTTRKIVFSIVLDGKITSDRGSPLAKVTGYADGVFWTASGYPPDTDAAIAADIDNRLQLLAIKKGAICELFCQDGHWMEIQPYNGSAPIKFQPRILDISWEQGNWVNYVPFKISMEADVVDFAGVICCADDGDNDIDAVEETWGIEQADDKGRTYRMTHNVSAQRPKVFNTDGSGDISQEGWEVAKALVLPRLGIDLSIRNDSVVLAELDDFNAYNYVRGETIDEANGKYSVSENWFLYKPEVTIDDESRSVIGCLEDFNVSTRISLQDDITTVTIDGTLTGLEERDNTTHVLSTTRWANVQARWAEVQPALLNRVQSYTGVTMNPLPLNRVEGQQPLMGVITYSYEYSNRAALLDDNNLSEIVSINDKLASDVFAKIPVLVRPLGPVLQDIGSKTDKSRTLNIEILVAAAKYPATVVAEPDPSEYITLYGPGGTYGFNPTAGPFIESNTKNWTPQNGRYSRTITWCWE